MLKVTNKQFEIEEPVQLTKVVDGKEEVLYEFKMQITADELQELKHILFDFANNNIKDYLKATGEEREQMEKKANEEIAKNSERLEDICFKEHKEEFKRLAGEYKYEEMKENIQGYLISFFMEKQMSHYNTPITNLTKTMNSLANLK